MERKSGILMPISALPSRYGIGALGEEARSFARFLADAGQRCWQLLPLGPTGYGDSPYSPFSTYAGNPYFIDPEELCADGLLLPGEAEAFDWGDDARYVDYGRIYASRFELLRLASYRAWERLAGELAAFEEENRRWLPDYALFMALKRRFGMVSWTEWPDEDARLRRPEALERYRRELAGDVRLFTFIQFAFFRQWDALRSYTRSLGLELIGDMPIYVAMDSADVWASPESFLLDERREPVSVAGVPPDYFSEDGQLWGNPLYDWERMASDGYGWWIRRVEGSQRLYDIIRIDHFRGFESYWSVPRGAKTAREGEWLPGPGMALVGILRDWFSDTRFIAEDLGILTPEVGELLRQSGFPGMRVLEFAFNSREPSDYLPHAHVENCVCYIGTHDNETLRQWFDALPEDSAAYAREYLGLSAEEGLVRGFLRAGMSSVAGLFIAQLQDVLGLGAEARMNVPGVPQGNWRWRLLPGEASPELAARLRELTRLYGR